MSHALQQGCSCHAFEIKIWLITIRAFTCWTAQKSLTIQRKMPSGSPAEGYKLQIKPKPGSVLRVLMKVFLQGGSNQACATGFHGIAENLERQAISLLHMCVILIITQFYSVPLVLLKHGRDTVSELKSPISLRMLPSAEMHRKSLLRYLEWWLSL